MKTVSTLLLCWALTTSVAQSQPTWQKPFSPTSPWNTQISHSAALAVAGFQPASWMSVDEELLYITHTGDPTHNVYAPIDWAHRCGGDRIELEGVVFPDSIVIPDATENHTPNNCAAILQPDGRTIIQINPLTRCTAGGPLYGWKAETVDLSSDGVHGGHGGSGLSSIGGTIRLGELTNRTPIEHALKVNVWGKNYLWKFTGEDVGYRWPANRHDGCAPDCYGGTNKELRLGSLLTIPSSVADTIQLETVPGKKLLQALRQYGAYIVDDTAWDAYALCVEQGVRKEFRSTYAMAIEAQSGPWYRDCMKLFRNMMVVTNNGPHSIGGNPQIE